MANHRATGKKAYRGPELVQRCRDAILEALEIADKGGENITELLAKEYIANPLKFLELASKFCPKDVSLEIDDMRNNAEQFSDAELADIVARGRARAIKSPTSEKAVH